MEHIDSIFGTFLGCAKWRRSPYTHRKRTCSTKYKPCVVSVLISFALTNIRSPYIILQNNWNHSMQSLTACTSTDYINFRPACNWTKHDHFVIFVRILCVTRIVQCISVTATQPVPTQNARTIAHNWQQFSNQRAPAMGDDGECTKLSRPVASRLSTHAHSCMWMCVHRIYWKLMVSYG